MARDPAHAGDLKERVTFWAPSLDANGDLLGPFKPLFDARARIESNPGPMRVQAMRLEGESAICVTVRASLRTRRLQSNWRLLWHLPERTYVIHGTPVLDERRAWIVIWATAYAGGPGG